MTSSCKVQTSQIVLATKNLGKLSEFTALFREHGLDIKIEGPPGGLELPNETGTSYRENASLKAEWVGQRLQSASLADDSGLEVQALSGAPGLHSARFGGAKLSDPERVQLLLEALRGVHAERRGARFVCCLALFLPATGSTITSEGFIEGRILEESRGKGGFGYDPVFFIPFLGKTLAEICPEEKNKISHRAKALERLLAGIKGPGE